MKILLTGHEGFIGKRLLEKLRALNYTVDTVGKQLFDNGLRDKVLGRMVERADIIFHVGAMSDTSLQDMGKMMRYNYSASKELFNLAQTHNKKVIYSSSAACLGDGDTPNNIYGWSKLIAEEYGIVKCDEFVSLRYFNVYGPGEECKGRMASVAYQAWERAMGKAAVNQRIRLRQEVGSLIQKDSFFRLFPTQPQRDFIYIDDVIEANLHAVTAKKGVYEIGYGEARTFESLLDGMGLEYKHHRSDKIPSWYQHYTCADKDKRLLGWTPEFDVESGTKKYRDHLALASVAQR